MEQWAGREARSERIIIGNAGGAPADSLDRRLSRNGRHADMAQLMPGTANGGAAAARRGDAIVACGAGEVSTAGYHPDARSGEAEGFGRTGPREPHHAAAGGREPGHEKAQTAEI